jgi:hypothetical protein
MPKQPPKPKPTKPKDVDLTKDKVKKGGKPSRTG